MVGGVASFLVTKYTAILTGIQHSSIGNHHISPLKGLDIGDLSA